MTIVHVASISMSVLAVVITILLHVHTGRVLDEVARIRGSKRVP